MLEIRNDQRVITFLRQDEGRDGSSSGSERAALNLVEDDGKPRIGA